jgi:hypothetical protein
MRGTLEGKSLLIPLQNHLTIFISHNLHQVVSSLHSLSLWIPKCCYFALRHIPVLFPVAWKWVSHPFLVSTPILHTWAFISVGRYTVAGYMTAPNIHCYIQLNRVILPGKRLSISLLLNGLFEVNGIGINLIKLEPTHYKILQWLEYSR